MNHFQAKEIQIRKQFRAAVKTQTRQYKALQMQLMATLPKLEHAEMINKLKEEQKRKLASLADQYESSIGSMVQDQTVRPSLMSKLMCTLLVSGQTRIVAGR
jgi:hypothetical protein